jgi:hypothetical protein
MPNYFLFFRNPFIHQRTFIPIVKRTGKILVFLAIVSTFLYLSFSQTWASTYDYETHNCMHMSEELEDTLELLPPIKAEVVFGEGSESHMWIRVYSLNIESTMPLPVPAQVYREAFPHQEVYSDFREFARIYLQQ